MAYLISIISVFVFFWKPVANIPTRDLTQIVKNEQFADKMTLIQEVNLLKSVQLDQAPSETGIQKSLFLLQNRESCQNFIDDIASILRLLVAQPESEPDIQALLSLNAMLTTEVRSANRLGYWDPKKDEKLRKLLGRATIAEFVFLQENPSSRKKTYTGAIVELKFEGSQAAKNALLGIFYNNYENSVTVREHGTDDAVEVTKFIWVALSADGTGDLSASFLFDDYNTSHAINVTSSFVRKKT